MLGKGAFGKVNLGVHKLTSKLVAIKSISKEYLSVESSKKKVMQEYSILKITRHPSIIKIYETFESAKYILIVMELCSGGDLLNFVRKRRRLTENMAKYVFNALINGLNHIHKRNIIHRDIKLDNILLNNEGELKICDFGVAKIIDPNEIIKEQCGTPAYIAPEILSDQGYSGFGVDVWSAGVALYAMLYGTIPFKSQNMKELNKLIIKGQLNLKDDITYEARDLLKSMLEINPRKRITIQDIFKHPWMSDVPKKVELFSDSEKEIIKKEYCYVDKNVGINESNLFTEHNIDSSINELTKNASTKSIILAPFNSTTSEMIEGSSDQKAIDKKELIKFSPKVRDYDRQYEKNNNGELDNGVYNKFVCESKVSNQSIENDELECVKNSIESKEDVRLNNDSHVESKKDLGFSQHKLICSDNLDKSDLSIQANYDDLEINSEAMKQLENFGFPKFLVENGLKSNELNHATTTYYLLL